MKRFLIILFILPICLLLLYSISGIWVYPSLLPSTINFRGFSFISNNYRDLLQSIGVTLSYSLCTVVLSFVLTILPASFLSRNNFLGKGLLQGFLLSPVLIPSITFSMGLHWLFIKVGLSDTFFGVVLILTLFSYPYMLRSLITGYSAYSINYDICGKNLGGNIFFRIVHIHLPLLLPSIISGSTIVFLSSFASYFLVFLIGGGRVKSFTGYLIPFLQSEDLNISSILSIIFLIIPLILFVLIERFVKKKRFEKN